jgi:outer membrane receptor protein involved in Fe transport
LPGLSKEVSNITLYYEKYGFSARVSQRKRSDFRGEIQGFGGDRDPNRFIRGEEIIDFQLGYAFADGTALEGLSLLLQVNNATNEPYREFFPDSGDAEVLQRVRPPGSARRHLQVLTTIPTSRLLTPLAYASGSCSSQAA